MSLAACFHRPAMKCQIASYVRALTGSLISGLNQTGAIAGAFADSSGEGSSNYAGGVYHSLWRSFRASRSVATYVRTCPDISGSFGITGNDADRGFSTSHTDGCFTTKTTTLGGLDSGASSYRTGIPYFVASRVSSIFGGSSGVDVSAVYALIIIKV